ncbi:cytidylyltransferase domain-containing protein [Algibacter sp. L3A6]|uniref:cytidylyltransferase domain-containing protein n=1 Tax=Algibacter sp. L3A6 TaxID=2686366 RepID=UPI00131A61BA|nr:spore coat protein [Algibacter sp. L3A6]
MKIGAIIQARYDSTRLPGKVLLNLPFNENESILGHIIERLNKIKLLDEVIVATSKEQNDDIIEKHLIKKNVVCVRGDKNDVLDRFVVAIDANKLDVVIRITGDNPIVLVDVLEDAIKKHIQANVDYTRNVGLPYGTSFEIINSNVLKRISANKELVDADREHVTIYIKNNRKDFRILELEHNFEHTNFRFTIDYPTDYAAMNILFQHLSSLNYIYNIDTLLNFLKNNTWVQNINKTNYQKKQYKTLNDELNGAIELLDSLEFVRVVDLLNIKRRAN